MAKNTIKVGDVITSESTLKVVPVARPLIVTSVNADGTVNGRLIIEPEDNPNNDGNFQTFLRNVNV